MIDEYLGQLRKTRHSVTPDGHCILRSWSVALKEEHRFQDVNTRHLIKRAKCEILENLDHYADNITADCDIIRELEIYEQRKDFSQDIVDLILYALCNCTSTSVYLFHVQENEVIRTLIEPTRAAVTSNKIICLARCGCHYDPVLDVLQPKYSQLSDVDQQSTTSGATYIDLTVSDEEIESGRCDTRGDAFFIYKIHQGYKD